VAETIDQLRLRYLHMDAQYRALGDRMTQLMSARDPSAKGELDDVFGELQDLYEKIGRVQQELRERLRQDEQ
jgi:hypothetical protein